MQEYFVWWRNNPAKPKFTLTTTDEFKLMGRGIELAYLTNGNYDHITWILMGQTGLTDYQLLGYIQSAVAIRHDLAYITKAY